MVSNTRMLREKVCKASEPSVESPSNGYIGHGADGGPQPDSDGTIIVAEVFGNKPGINVPGCGETLQSTSGALY